MGLAAVFKRPFDEQVAFFRGKMGNLIPTERWTDVWKSAHDTGFMVAGAAKADLLADFAGAVDRAISEGTGIGKFREDFDAIVEKHGWSYRGEYNWRTRTIYRTNMATSYSAGRLVQLQEDGYPFWMYRHSDSVARPRPLHVSWDGLTIPANDSWWETHYPPNGWGCQCYVIGVRNDRMARRLGGKMAKAPDDGVGADGTPNGIDKGWDYQPGATAVEQVRNALRERAAALPAQIASGLKKDLDISPNGSNIQNVDAAIKQATPTSKEMTMTQATAPKFQAAKAQKNGKPAIRFTVFRANASPELLNAIKNAGYTLDNDMANQYSVYVTTQAEMEAAQAAVKPFFNAMGEWK
jgi:hypothetical protein